MTKIVYNACYGGFSISDAAVRRYAELKGLTLYPTGGVYWTVPPEDRQGYLSGDAWYLASSAQRVESNAFYDANTVSIRMNEHRCDPILVQVVEELGAAANGDYAQLTVIDLPPGTRYRVNEYDGYESIETEADIAWSIA